MSAGWYLELILKRLPRGLQLVYLWSVNETFNHLYKEIKSLIQYARIVSNYFLRYNQSYCGRTTRCREDPNPLSSDTN